MSFFFEGRAFCLCPVGWTLDTDWKTCIDIDECTTTKYFAKDLANNENSLCDYKCENTIGSYRCIPEFEAGDQPIELQDDGNIPLCANGFQYNKTMEDCLGKYNK